MPLSNAIFVNRLIAILSVIQDYYNDTLPDPSIMLQNSFGSFYRDLTGDVNITDLLFLHFKSSQWEYGWINK